MRYTCKFLSFTGFIIFFSYSSKAAKNVMYTNSVENYVYMFFLPPVM